MCHPQAVAAAALLLVPLAAALVALALTVKSWGRVVAGPPRADHQVLGTFGVWEVALHARFLPDPARPWLRAPPALRIPWIPLKHFVGGPPGVRRFRRQVLPCTGSRAAPSLRDLAIVIADPSEEWASDDDERNWDASAYASLVPVAAAMQNCAFGCIAALAAGFSVQLFACSCGRAAAHEASNRRGLRLLLRGAGVLHLGASLLALLGLVRFLATFRYKFRDLVSEFLFALTDGDIAIWPTDIDVGLDAGAYVLAAGVLAAFVSGLLLLACDVQGPAPAAAGGDEGCVPAGPASRDTAAVAGSAEVLATVASVGEGLSALAAAASSARVVRIRSDASLVGADTEEAPSFAATAEDAGPAVAFTPAAALAQRALIMQQMELTRAQLRAHNARVLARILAFMVVFVALLSGVGFFLGRRAVEQGLQNALRGPQLRVKQAELAIQQARYTAHDTVRNTTSAGLSVVASGTRSAVGAAVGTVAATQSAARSVSDVLRSQDWDAVRRASTSLAAGVVRAPGGACRLGKRALEGVRGLRAGGRDAQEAAQALPAASAEGGWQPHGDGERAPGGFRWPWQPQQAALQGGTD